MKNLTKTVFNSLLWTSFGTAITYVFKTVVMVVLARLLSPSDFGIIGTAMILVNFSNRFVSMGFGPSLIQRVELESRHISTAFTLNTVLGLTFFAVVFFSSNLIGRWFDMDGLNLIIRVMSVLLITRSLSINARALLQRSMAFKLLTKLDFFSYLFGYVLVSLTLAFLGYGVWSLVFGTVIESVVICLSLLWVNRHNLVFSFDKKSFKELFSFSAGQTLYQLGKFFSNQADNLVVSKLLGASAMGIYGRSYQLLSVPAKMYAMTMNKVLFPAISKVQDDKVKMGNAYSIVFKLLAFLLLPLSIFLYTFAEEFIVSLLGSEWMASIGPAKYFSIALFFRLAISLNTVILKSVGKVYTLSVIEGASGLLILTAAALGASSGLNGVAAGVTIVVILTFLVLFIETFKVIQVRLAEFLKPLVSLLLILLVFRFIVIGTSLALRANLSNDFYILSLGFVICGLLYSLVFWFFRKTLFLDIMIFIKERLGKKSKSQKS